MLQNLYKIMRFRNVYPAFNGEIRIDETAEPGKLRISWIKDNLQTTLDADFRNYRFSIKYTDEKSGTIQNLYETGAVN